MHTNTKQTVSRIEELKKIVVLKNTLQQFSLFQQSILIILMNSITTSAMQGNIYLSTYQQFQQAMYVLCTISHPNQRDFPTNLSQAVILFLLYIFTCKFHLSTRNTNGHPPTLLLSTYLTPYLHIDPCQLDMGV
jgi:hypothetical protein